MNSSTTRERSPGVRYVMISPDRDGQRLDNFVAGELGRIPRGLVYRLIRTGQVRVNGGRAKPRQRLRAGDRVRLPPVHTQPPAQREVPESLVESVRESIVHKEEALIVLDKPAGLAVHGGSGLSFGLVDVLSEIHPGIHPVHRLDRATSGLMVFALGRRAAAALHEAFREGRVGKRYLALMTGRLGPERVAVDAPLKKIRDASGQHRVIAAEDGEAARTVFKVLERMADHTYVEADIATGRTHQIRAHAAHLGHPIAGDERYNPGPEPPGLKRLFLHAHYLRLPWPEDRIFNSPLPDELRKALDGLVRCQGKGARNEERGTRKQ